MGLKGILGKLFNKEAPISEPYGGYSDEELWDMKFDLDESGEMIDDQTLAEIFGYRNRSELDSEDGTLSQYIRGESPYSNYGTYSGSSTWGPSDDRQRSHVLTKTMRSGRFDEEGEEIFIPLMDEILIKGNK